MQENARHNGTSILCAYLTIKPYQEQIDFKGPCNSLAPDVVTCIKFLVSSILHVQYASTMPLRCWGLQITCSVSSLSFKTLNSTSVHRTFPYHSPIVYIWLKHCWKGIKEVNCQTIHWQTRPFFFISWFTDSSHWPAFWPFSKTFFFVCVFFPLRCAFLSK